MTPLSPLGWRERGALLLGHAAGAAAQRLGRGGGSALPGLVAARVAPGLLRALAGSLGRGVVTITGTNGKTTTAHLLAAAVRAAGLDPLANHTGSNLERGLIAACAAETDPRGAIRHADARLGVFEVDEAVLPTLFAPLRPRVAIFLNLFRDQLDRYGEVDSVAAGWQRMLQADTSGCALVLNADDPSVAVLAGIGRGEVITFGIEDRRAALPGAEHAMDARFHTCGAPFAYDAVYMGHVGIWRCTSCGAVRRAPDVAAHDVVLGADATSMTIAVRGERFPVRLPMAGLYSVYNALAAAAGACALGLPVAAIRTALSDAGPAFGRQELLHLHQHGVDRDVRILLAKNPTGLNEVLRVLCAADAPPTVLAMLNDGIQDGQDVSWIYDADVEMLAGRVGAVVCGGVRAEELALRFALAGIEPAAIEPQAAQAIARALALVPPGGRLEIVPTYTAMIEVREALARAAGVAPFWRADPRDGRIVPRD